MLFFWLCRLILAFLPVSPSLSHLTLSLPCLLLLCPLRAKQTLVRTSQRSVFFLSSFIFYPSFPSGAEAQYPAVNIYYSLQALVCGGSGPWDIRDTCWKRSWVAGSLEGENFCCVRLRPAQGTRTAARLTRKYSSVWELQVRRPSFCF